MVMFAINFFKKHIFKYSLVCFKKILLCWETQFNKVLPPDTVYCGYYQKQIIRMSFLS